MAIDNQKLGHMAIELMDSITEDFGEDAEIEVLVMCARVKNLEGRWGTWITRPGGDKQAAAILRPILASMEHGLGERASMTGEGWVEEDSGA